MKRILLSVPHMSGAEEGYVHQAFASNWLSTVGPNINAFEREFSNRVGLPAAALGSCTAAIHLGLRLLGVGPGDEVFSPTLTFVAGCNPIHYLSAESVFLDSNYTSWNLDPNILEDALRERAQRKKLPRALIVVHLYGQCADMDPIMELCHQYGVPVLEDAAEALGSTYKGRPAGSIGDIGVFSFNGNKIITTTGGGMLVSRNAAWVEKARFWSQQARDPGLAYEHSEMGYNYRMSNVPAGIGRGQLEVLDLRVEQRRAIAFRYRDAFADLPGITLMPQAPYGLHTNWLSCFLIDEREFGSSRDELIRALDEANVEARPVWKPMHLQPLYAGCQRYGGEVAEDLFRRGICLPSSSSLSEEDQLHVINSVRKTAGADVLTQTVPTESRVEAGTWSWPRKEQSMRKARGFLEKFKAIPRLIVWLAQIAMFAVSGVLAFLLRFDFSLPPAYLRHLAYALPIWIVVKATVFRVAKLDRGLWRYVTESDLFRLVNANLIASAVSCILIRVIAPYGFPRSIYVLDLIVCFLATSGLRVVMRRALQAASYARSRLTLEKSALIYGAGDAGVTLLREIRNNPRLSYRVVGFLDDWPDKKGLRIAGVPVLGGGDQTASLVKKHNVDVILIAIPSATGAEMARILRLCHAVGVECKTVPGLAEVMEERGLAGQIRQVAVEDLLGRTPVHLEEKQIRGTLEGKIVLVTGAAGSIGSELCRQIAHFSPAAIIGFEVAESPLFDIELEMRQTFPQVPFHPEIGSIQSRSRLDDVLCQYRPSVVYHAAAYKHVPLMESHVFEAIENNVFGTYNVAMAAAEHGVEDFIMISSDKAVRPTNVMGATKRVAELVLLALQNGSTKYVAVRFGNVLGSSGSVIPLFKKQIAAGGPVTVTHPEMRRFFMTIPEASQLVLQASAIGKGGQICVLDMGQPVKIIDLARNLILLSGLKPDEDIKIEFTGIRPGEKLYEELSTLLEDTVPTEHNKIRIFMGNGMPEKDVLVWLDSLHEICEARDTGRLVVALKEMVLDYSPSTHLLKRVIKPRDQHTAAVTSV